MAEGDEADRGGVGGDEQCPGRRGVWANSQLRRAAVSVARTIAEGQGRLSTGEFVQFLGMASGSTLEVQTQLDAANMLKFGLEIDLECADTTSTEVVLIVNAAITRCRAKIVTKNKAKGVDRR